MTELGQEQVRARRHEPCPVDPEFVNISGSSVSHECKARAKERLQARRIALIARRRDRARRPSSAVHSKQHRTLGQAPHIAGSVFVGIALPSSLSMGRLATPVRAS